MFERLDNFRDFGGYPTRDGRTLAKGRLYRSAHHAHVTDADLARLQALGIEVFVDLRNTFEREKQPCRRPAGFTGRLIDNDIGAEEPDGWVNFLQSTDELSGEAFRGFMRRFYREGAYMPRHIDLFRQYFDALAETDGAVLIHCAAGKDRTGVLAALTHHLAGVAEADIVHDFLLTNTNGGLDRRAPEIMNTVAQRTGKTITHDIAMAALLVEPDYILSTFEEMAQRYGSVDGYLAQVVGVTPDKGEAIRARLLA